MKPIPHALAASLAPRILNSIRHEDGCWIRTTAVHPKTGYSQIATGPANDRQYFLVHRVMYVYAKGSIPENFDIDHLCERPSCCNPEHLRAVDHRTNVLRSRSNPAAINARKTHCKRGHELERMPNGTRGCRTCLAEGERERRQRRKEAGPPPGEHGTRRGYQHWGCRCDECRAWNHAAYAAKKAARPC